MFYIDKYGNKIYTNSKGERHRLNGPAFDCFNGNCWYLLNKYLEEEEFNSWIERIKCFI